MLLILPGPKLLTIDFPHRLLTAKPTNRGNRVAGRKNKRLTSGVDGWSCHCIYARLKRAPMLHLRKARLVQYDRHRDDLILCAIYS